MSRLPVPFQWAIAACLVVLTIAVAGAQVGRPGAGQTVRVYEGVSTEGDFQQALDRAVARALRALPGADRMIQYRVREITGEQGGIRGLNTVRVAIEVTGEDGRPAVEEPALPERPPVPEENQAAEELRRALDVQLRVPARVRPGAVVTLDLTVRNTSNRPIRAPFASAQQYDFEVWRGDQLVYRWSQGRVFAQALTELRLNPGQAITFTGTWNQRSADGVRVQPGEYTVRGYLPTRLEGGRIGDSARVTIR
jgi:hypothetical protein